MTYIGIDIGGTKCAVVRGDLNGITEKIRFETTTPDATLSAIFSAVESLLPADSIGISCGGPLDEDRGVIMSPPNLPGWDNVRITDMLSDRFGIPAYLCNDANACALAEWRFGAGRGSRNMIFLTFGTGLGAGIILDGRLYSGTNGMAGEVGHIRLSDDGPIGFGKRGSFEGYCSGGGIAQLGRLSAQRAIENGAPFAWAQNDNEISKITTKYLAELASAGDENALKIFRESAKRLGFGLSVLIDILNPERIIIGSVYQRCESLFYTEMMRVIEEEALPESLSVCKILPAELGDELGDLAAISVAMKGMDQ